MHFLYQQWFGYWWPSDKGNGPENIQWTVLAVVAASFLIPVVRHFIKHEFDKVHAKLDHVIKHSENVPEYIEPEFEKWEHWVVKLFRRTRSAAATGPTPAQVTAANLVAQAPPLVNGKPERSWNQANENFPPIQTVYVTPPTPVKPPPTAPTYTLKYVSEFANETLPPNVANLAIGAKVIVGAGVAESGYTFDGWGDGKFIYAPGSTYTMPSENVTMTAIWTAVVPPVTPTPPVNPTPPPSATQPSGIAITPVAPGYTRALSDDFTSPSLDPTKWAAPYDGVSGGTASGLFGGAAHLLTPGDSMLHLLAFPDPTNIVKCYGYTPALAASVNNWCGAGTASLLKIGPGSLARVCMKFNTYPGIAPMAIYFGASTEIDWAETNDITTKGQAITEIYGSVHWANHSESANGIPLKAPPGVDFSQWGVFGIEFTATSLVFTHSVDGVNYVQVGSYTFTAAQLASDVLSTQNLCLQIQTGDVMPNPPADPSVTASSPVAMDVDWVTVDVQS